MKEKNNYQKPLLLVEQFIPNAYIADCDIADIHFTSSTVTEYTQDGSALYYDKPPQNGKYDEGERVGVSTASSNHTVRVSISTNVDLNYMGTGYQGNLIVKNLMNQNLPYYSAKNTRGNYTTQPGILAALMDTNGVTHYFNSNTTTITRVANMS